MHAVFRQTLTESAFVLKTQANILGKCVKKARPYYEKLGHAKKVTVYVVGKCNLLISTVRVLLRKYLLGHD